MRSAPRIRNLALVTAATAALLLLVTAVAWWIRWPQAGTGPSHAPGPRAERLLHRAEQLLLRSCMRQAGFDYHPVPGDAADTGRDSPYVLDDEVWAREHGYDRDRRERLRAAPERDPNRRYFASLPPERRAVALVAANGPRPDGVRAALPTGGVIQRSDRGCVSEAQRRLYGDLQEWFQVSATVRALEPLRRSRVTGDPRYVRDLAAWARCMRGAGHPYPSPADARAAALSPTHPMPRARETALATAEARCAVRSGLARTARRLDEVHRAELARGYKRDIDRKNALQARALPRARAVIDGHEGA
ncbi:hypothetical protein ACSNOK_21755 [Streptomyces sp. URMC 126]|uniref:hypothetical protein n=1 Tax=Streptomyces sp. URMC 126 TaxID=3423401 RepID=UPI003F1A3AEC